MNISQNAFYIWEFAFAWWVNFHFEEAIAQILELLIERVKETDICFLTYELLFASHNDSEVK